MSETSKRVLNWSNMFGPAAATLAREVEALEEQARRRQRCELCDSEFSERERALLDELAAVKLALQKSNDDLGAVAEVVVRVVKERDEALARAEKAERVLAAADVEASRLARQSADNRKERDIALAKLAEAEREREDWERLPLVERIRQLEELVGQESDRANDMSCKLASAERVVEAYTQALRIVAVQDLDQNGEPDTLEHLANHSDAGTLAGALIHCATVARDALRAHDFGETKGGDADAGARLVPRKVAGAADSTSAMAPQARCHGCFDPGCSGNGGAAASTATSLTRERLGAALARTHDLCRREGGGRHAVLRALELLHDEVLREPDAGPAFAAALQPWVDKLRRDPWTAAHRARSLCSARQQRRYEMSDESPLSDEIDNDPDARAWADDVRALEDELTAVKASLMPATATFQEFDEMRRRSPAEVVRRLVHERDALNAQVTALQTRCTELLEERRRASVDYAAREFHLAMGIPAPAELAVPPDDRVRLRCKLVAEEFFELLGSMLGTPRERPWYGPDARERVMWIIEHAPVDVDLPGWARETHDLDYVVAGTRVEFGYRGNAGAAEIHAANMRKVGGEVREDGKILKPDGWVEPDMGRVLAEQGYRQ